VLVNKVANLDVGGQLLRTLGSNAAVCVKAAQLAGGCACCSVSDDPQASLEDIARSSSCEDNLVR
jgi:G3E family GTPase